MGRTASLRRTAGLAAGQAGAFLLVLLLVSLCAPLHVLLLERGGVEERAGISAEETGRVARAMTAVMRGEDAAVLSEWFTADEVAHMRDVRALVRTGWMALAGCAALLLQGLFPRYALDAEQSRRCAARALGVILLAAAAVFAACAMDFHGAFLAFHRVFFRSNTLWLMDPRVHRMVVIYNEEFFSRIATVIGALCAASLLPLACAAIRRGKDGQRP